MNPLEGNDSVSLYLHIPTCERWCSYCAFYSEERSCWEGKTDEYVLRMADEIESARKLNGKPFDTIFIGGGNPFCIGTEALSLLLETAGESRETTVEMNPESMNPSTMDFFSRGLVNRLSMGIQSMDQGHLTVLGRNSSWAQNLVGIESAMRVKEKYGMKLNFDLITCMPNETIEEATNDIDSLLSLSEPDHLSLYCLTLEKGTPLAKQVREGKLNVPDEETQAIMLFDLWHHLEDKGYEHYEVSAFAKNQAWCRHNLRYWMLKPYLGIGCSAASRLSVQGTFTDVRNDQTFLGYRSSPIGSGYHAESLSKNQEMEEFLLVTLRTRWGIMKQDFLQRFGISFDSLFQKRFSEIPFSYYVDTHESFVLTERGLMSLDSVVLSLSMAI